MAGWRNKAELTTECKCHCADKQRLEGIQTISGLGLSVGKEDLGSEQIREDGGTVSAPLVSGI